MSSYSIDFPHDLIDDVLGDDVETIDLDGNSAIFKGVFEFKYMEDELGEAIDIVYPTVECSSTIAVNISKRHKIIFNAITYSVLKKRPLDGTRTELILRSDYDS